MQTRSELPARSAMHPSLWMLVSWVTIFLVGTDLFIVSAFLPLIGQELDKPAASLAILVSAFSLTYAVACPIQGRVAERWGLRAVLVSGVAALSAANYYTAIAPDLVHLALSRVLAGFAAASISPMLYALAAEHAGPSQRASRLAQVNSGLVISLCLGAPFGLVIGDMTNWRLVFMGLAAMLLIMVPINAAVWAPKTSRTLIVQLDATSERLLDTWPLLVCMVAWSVSVYAAYTLLATAYSQDFTFSAQDIALALFCFGAGATVGVVAGGRLADRIGTGRQVRLSLALMTLAFAICHVAYRSHLQWMLVVSLFAISFVAYGFFPAIQACAAQAFTTRRPTVLGLMSSALYIGITVGSSLGVSVFKAYGMADVLLMCAVVASLGWLVSMSPFFAARHPAD